MRFIKTKMWPGLTSNIPGLLQENMLISAIISILPNNKFDDLLSMPKKDTCF